MANRQEAPPITSDLVGFHQDEIQDLHAETLQYFNPPKDDPTKPCYYFSQEYRSSIVIEHIKKALWIHHKMTLKDFNNIDFQIYTARSNSLEQQTLARLMDPGANCFNTLFYKKSKKEKYKQASKHINQYVNSYRAKKRSDQLFEEAKNNKNTLYLIVADEAHWGISDKSGGKKAGKEEESQEEKEAKEVMGAHNKFINKWKDFPNVIVLQISATPYNLLTKQSRLANVSVAKVKDEDMLMIVEKERHQIFAYPNGKDDPGSKYEVTGRVGPVRDLHRIEWSYGTLDDFRGGVLVKLQIPCENKMLWLSTKQDVDQEQWKLLEGTKNCSEDFLLATNNGCDMQIFTSDKVSKLVVIKKKTLQNFQVRMVPAVDCDHLSKQYDIIDNFQLVMDFGEDIIEIQCQWQDKSKRVDQMLYYNKNKQEVGITRSPMLANSLFPDHDIKYQFLLHSWRSAQDQIGHDCHYLSLNHFFNSMRDETHSLLRKDKHFETYCQKSEFEPDALLIAEYSMFVLLYECLKEFIMPEVKLLNDILRSQEYDDYIQKRKKKFAKFEASLRPPLTITVSEFQHVVDYYCTTARLCTQNAKTNDQAIKAFLFNLMFNEDIQKLFDIPSINQSSCRLNELKETELHSIETYRIVNDLIVDIAKGETGGVLQGHMKIVRVSKMEWGDRLYKTLCIARISQLSTEKNRNYFEIIRDYGAFKLTNFHTGERDDVMTKVLHRIRSSMQTSSCQYVSHKFETCPCEEYSAKDVNRNLKCKKCGHLHKEVKQYSDLNGLPCLLVLVDKGRLGDTFPQSMTTMDLRLNNKGRSTPCLTTAIQELGRMCRYVSKNKREMYQYPYALLGKNMFKTLDSALKTWVPIYGPFVRRDRIDSRIKLVDNKFLEAKPDHFDYGNTEKHNNRILLKAEPQIGKTGVFLNVIKSLSQIIQKNNEVVSENENEFDEADLDEADLDETEGDDFDETEDMDIAYHETPNDTSISREDQHGPSYDMELWKVPHWKDMNNDTLKTKIPNSKYARSYGPYEYGKQPKLLPQSKQRCQDQEQSNSTPSSQRKYSLINQQFRSLTYDINHIKDCELCSKQPEVVEHQFNFSRNDYDVNVRLSVPTLPQYLPVFRKLRIPGYDTGNHLQSDTGEDEIDGQILESWIFTPTHNRYSTGNLNLNHTMVNDEGVHCSYVHVLVVRPEQYNIYRTYFKNSHCIIQLPHSIESAKYNCKDGGVGFARYFIQILADELKLPTYFMLDDNIPAIIDITKNWIDSNGKYQLARVPFFQVFSAIENQLLNRCERPNVKLMPYDTQSSETNLEQYTGPCEKYGIVGIMKLRQGSTRIKNPFKKTHVTSLVCVNRKALEKKNITYKPWPVFEDLTANNDCDKNYLWVCKYTRFQMVKRNLASSILPDVYADRKASKPKAAKQRTPRKKSIELVYLPAEEECLPKLPKTEPSTRSKAWAAFEYSPPRQGDIPFLPSPQHGLVNHRKVAYGSTSEDGMEGTDGSQSEGDIHKNGVAYGSPSEDGMEGTDGSQSEGDIHKNGVAYESPSEDGMEGTDGSQSEGDIHKNGVAYESPSEDGMEGTDGSQSEGDIHKNGVVYGSPSEDGTEGTDGSQSEETSNYKIDSPKNNQPQELKLNTESEYSAATSSGEEKCPQSKIKKKQRVKPRRKNYKKHGLKLSIKMVPAHVNKVNGQEVHDIQYNQNASSTKPPKYKYNVGDLVRIYDQKKVYTRRYHEKWNGEVLQISERFITTDLPMYKLTDYDNEEIVGLFCAQDLQAVTPGEVFRVEKRIKTSKRKGHPKEYLVRQEEDTQEGMTDGSQEEEGSPQLDEISDSNNSSDEERSFHEEDEVEIQTEMDEKEPEKEPVPAANSKNQEKGEVAEFLELMALVSKIGVKRAKEILLKYADTNVQFNAEQPDMQQPIIATGQIPSTLQVPQVQPNVQTTSSSSSSLFD